MKAIRKAVIPVAGLGTRFLPATKAIPKEMLTIVDRPTIQYIVEEAVASGIEEIILITSAGKSAIENHFDYDFQLDTVLKDRNKDADAGGTDQYLQPDRYHFRSAERTAGPGACHLDGAQCGR